MGVRTVFLDDDDEAVLAALCEQSGLSISDVLKRGLESYAQAARDETVSTPFDVYRRLDLGQSGHARGPAADAKTTVVEALREKHRE